MATATDDSHSDFHPDLPAVQVHAALLTALAEYRRAERCAVLWFAEARRRELYRQLGYGSIQQYATEALGISRSRTFQFLRLSDALQKLPTLRAAVAAGQVGWTKADEVAKVATPRTERRWVSEAQHTSRRDLAAKVKKVRRRAAARVQRDPGQGELLGREQAGAPAEPVADVPVTMTLRMTALQRARFDALIEKLRRQGVGGSREEVLLAALEETAGRQDRRGGKDPREARDPQSSRRDSATNYQVVVYKCESCKRAEVGVAGERRGLPAAQVEAIECDARVLEPGRPNRSTIPPAVRRAVLARDGYRCRAPGCTHTHFLEVHHVVPRIAGGTNRPENLTTLCSACHRAAHEGESRNGLAVFSTGSRPNACPGHNTRL